MLSKHYELQQNIRIGKIEYDVVAISKQDNVDLIYEIKYWINPTPTLIDQMFYRLNEAGVNYVMNMQRSFKAKLLIVSKGEELIIIKKMIDKYLANSSQSYSFIDVEYFLEDELTLYC